MFLLIQNTIKQKTLSGSRGKQQQEGGNVTIIDSKHSPLLKSPCMTSVVSILEGKLRTQVKVSETICLQDDSANSSQCTPAPITLTPLPPPPGELCRCRSEVVYADPADLIQSAPKPPETMAVYVDPVYVLPIQPPSSRELNIPTTHLCDTYPHFIVSNPDSVYSEVYDKISPLHNKLRFKDDEPIYSEPLSKTEAQSHKDETKVDPFAHLYAHVCKKAPSPSSTNAPSLSSSVTSSTQVSDLSLEDVIYENLGII